MNADIDARWIRQEYIHPFVKGNRPKQGHELTKTQHELKKKNTVSFVWHKSLWYRTASNKSMCCYLDLRLIKLRICLMMRKVFGCWVTVTRPILVQGWTKVLHTRNKDTNNKSMQQSLRSYEIIEDSWRWTIITIEDECHLNELRDVDKRVHEMNVTDAGLIKSWKRLHGILELRC